MDGSLLTGEVEGCDVTKLLGASVATAAAVAERVLLLFSKRERLVADGHELLNCGVLDESEYVVLDTRYDEYLSDSEAYGSNFLFAFEIDQRCCCCCCSLYNLCDPTYHGVSACTFLQP